MAKLLLVDDDPDILEAARQWLEHDKHEVETAQTGIKGTKLLEAGNFDLVVLDWDLPDVNGIDILKRYRENGGLTPIIMLTGRSDIDFKCQGLDSGADDYITKPFHMKELLSRIRSILTKAQREKQVSEVPGSNQELLLSLGLKGSQLASRFQILEVLGEGAFGLLLKARNPALDNFVAIKFIRKAELSPENKARFLQEAKAISQLDHSNIARLLDYGNTEKNEPYMVMEFIKGRTLSELLVEKKSLSLADALPLFMQIADGMAHAHKMGILHRDLKPSNLMLKGNREATEVSWLKILDFGCAKIRRLDNESEPAMTLQGQIVGSPLYMSPEQVQAESVDGRSDIYSFACIMYEVLTGQAPFQAEDSIAVMVKHVSEVPLALAQTCPQVQFPARLEALVARSLAKDPSKRFASMEEIKAELELLSKSAAGQEKETKDAGSKETWWQKLSKRQ